MKAIVQTAYGLPDAFELREMDRPEIRRANEVLVRVHAAALHAGDVVRMRGVPYFTRVMVGLPRPKNYVPGYDVAGTVVAVGNAVTHFQIGDEVFGSGSRTCAEYAVTAETLLEGKPERLSMVEAAAVPTSAVAALRGIRDVGKVHSGQSVLINGASGGVGTYAVQIAKTLGAEVWGVCGATSVDLVRSIGADHVIDYTKEDFTKGDRRFDLILDNVANHSLSDCWRVLTPQGKHLPNSGNSGMPYILKALVASLVVRRQGAPYVAEPKPQDLADLRQLIESGKLTPVIDKTFPLAEFSRAMEHVNRGHAHGKVVLTVPGGDAPTIE
jgi:NADPH:quinone reductase-like Zn-dependent oxidoreductase